MKLQALFQKITYREKNWQWVNIQNKHVKKHSKDYRSNKPQVTPGRDDPEIEKWILIITSLIKRCHTAKVSLSTPNNNSTMMKLFSLFELYIYTIQPLPTPLSLPKKMTSFSLNLFFQYPEAYHASLWSSIHLSIFARKIEIDCSNFMFIFVKIIVNKVIEMQCIMFKVVQ